MDKHTSQLAPAGIIPEMARFIGQFQLAIFALTAQNPVGAGIHSDNIRPYLPEESMSEPDTPADAQPSRATVILEICIGVVLTAAAGYIALTMPDHVRQGGMKEAQDFLKLSPVFFPQLTFALTGLVSAIFLVRTACRIPPAGHVGVGDKKANYGDVAIMAVIVIAYGLLLHPLGFTFATILMLGTLSYRLGTHSWWQLAAFSIVTPVFIRFFFERILNISLPLSPIEFLINLEQSVMRFLVGLLLQG